MLKSKIKWLSRKFILIIAAVMVGLSNVIYEEDTMINVGKNRTEQLQGKDEKD